MEEKKTSASLVAGSQAALLLVPRLGLSALVQAMHVCRIGSTGLLVLSLERERGSSAGILALSGTSSTDDLALASAGSITDRHLGRLLVVVAPVGLEGGAVLLERVGNAVPPRSAQRLGRVNGHVGTVGLTGRVLEVPVWGGVVLVPLGSLAQIGDISQRVVDVPGLGVDLVHAETGVQVSVRSDGGSDPGGGDGVLGRLGARAIEERELVVMGVTEELLGNDVGRVALDDLVVQMGPVLDTVGLGWSNMTNDPDTLTSVFGSLELLHEPLELTVGVVVLGVAVEVEVHGVAEVEVEGHDAQTRGRGGGVGAIVTDRLDSVGGQPAGPVVGEGVVQPLAVTARHLGGEQVGGASLVVADGGVDVGVQTSGDGVEGILGLGGDSLLGLQPNSVGLTEDRFRSG